MSTEEKMFLLSKYYSDLVPMLGENETIDYSYSQILIPYLVFFTRETKDLSTTARLLRIIFGKEKKGRFDFLYDSDMLMQDWETEKRFFGADKPEAYVHLALAYWYFKDSFPKAKEVLEYPFKKNMLRSYDTGGSILFELVKIFPVKNDGLFLVFSVYMSLGMDHDAKVNFKCMGFHKDEDFLFFKGLSFLFDEDFAKAKECFDMLVKKRDLLAKAYFYWAASSEELLNKEYKKVAETFKKCYAAFKKSEPIKSWGILDEQQKNNQLSIMLPQAAFVSDVISNRLDYSKKREALRAELKPEKKKPEESNGFLCFIAGYRLTIKPGPKRKGLLMINNKHIEISAIESDLCVTMARQIESDWRYSLGGEYDEHDIGWVPFETFEETVSSWVKLKERKHVIPNPIIINAVNRLNKKIRKAMRFNKKDRDLIENGEHYGRPKNYRFSVHPNKIKIL